MSSQFRVFVIALLSLVALWLVVPAVVQAGKPNYQDVPACAGNTGAVGPNACIGVQACAANSGDIGKNSCQGFQVCALNAGSVD